MGAQVVGKSYSAVQAFSIVAKGQLPTAPLNEAACDVHGALRMRRHLGIGQIQFANRYRLALGTLRNWEQGRSEPDRSAKVLLAAIAADPDGVARAAEHAGDPSYLVAGPIQAA